MEMGKEKLEREISKLEEKLRKLSKVYTKRNWRYTRDILKTSRQLMKAGTFDSFFLKNKLGKLERENEKDDLEYERESQKLNNELDNYLAVYNNLDKESRMIESEIESFKETSRRQIDNKYGVEISFNNANVSIESNSDGELANFKNSITNLDNENRDIENLIDDLQRAKNEV